MSDDSDGLPDSSADAETQFRQHLYQLLSDPSAAPDHLIEKLLALGCQRLEVENGHLVEIDPEAGRHEVVAASGSTIVQAGEQTDLESTFCRETITSDRILAFSHAVQDDWTDDPAYERWDLSCYIGSRVYVRDDLYGTVCFVNKRPRDRSFSEAERTSIDLLSRAISQVLERKRHDHELQHAEDLVELLVDEVSDYAIFLLDSAGQVATWNRGAQLLKGYTDEEIIGEHFARFYPEEARDAGRPAYLLEQARQQGRIEDEGWRVRKGGSRFWALVTITALYDEDGELRGYGKVTRDRTQQRATQQRLQAERAFTERALNTLDDLFFVLDLDGTLTRVNGRVETVTGYTEETLVGMEPASLFVEDDRERIEAAIETVLTTGDTEVEATLVTADGKRRQYEFRARGLIDEDGTITGAVGIGRDITARTFYEERLEVAQRVLRHNLRNEVNIIRGSAESLAETVSSDERPAVERILETADDLVELTEKSRLMTELEVVSEEDGERVDFVERLETMVVEFREAYPDAVIELDEPAALEVEMAAPDRVAVAVSNAIENAIEHNPGEQPWVRVALERKEGAVRVVVVDDGPTIPAEEREVINKGSERPLRHGSGLGLWLINWCVTTIGGDVEFTELASGGNRLLLQFPISAE